MGDLGEDGLLVLVADGVVRGLRRDRLPGAELPQLLAQGRVTVVAEGDREAGDGGLADAGEFGDLDAGEERGLGGVPDERVGDPPLGRGEPVALEELEQPGGRAYGAGVVGGGHQLFLPMRAVRTTVQQSRPVGKDVSTAGTHPAAGRISG